MFPPVYKKFSSNITSPLQSDMENILRSCLCDQVSLGKNKLVSVHIVQYLICSAFLNQLCHYLQVLMPSWASLKVPINRQGCTQTVHARKTFFPPQGILPLGHII